MFKVQELVAGVWVNIGFYQTAKSANKIQKLREAQGAAVRTVIMLTKGVY